MYTFWKRTIPPPSLAVFDAPDREKCIARRSRTNTPLQALVLMNDPTYVEAARALAERMVNLSDDPARRVLAGYSRVLGRVPNKAESAVLTNLAAEQQIRFAKNPEQAAQLLAVGESHVAAWAEPSELAAWTMVASSILNLDEAISKE